MRSRLLRPLWALPLLLSLACKDSDTLSARNQEQQFQNRMNEGNALLGNDQPELAARAFGAAASLAPDRTEPLLMQSEAHRRAGNTGAAILALKQAMTVNPSEAPDIKRKLAERYERDGLLRQAVAVLLELRDAGQLGEMEILRLAHLQTMDGQHEAAFKTLERIQKERPDDIDAKVVEAEILLAKGEEVLATKLMDRLLEEQPGLTAARVLRARFFLKNGYAEYADQDLQQIPPEEALRPEFVTLRVGVLLELKKTQEAEQLLAKALTENPRNAELLARLAELKFDAGNKPEAQQLSDQALKVQPESARALYVRGRLFESADNLPRARQDYSFALSENPRFAPAISRMWRLQDRAGEDDAARASLEQLLSLGDASLEEKVALADLYARTRTRVDQGLKLIDEALKQDPSNLEYQEIQKELKKNQPRKKASGGPLIMRGRR